MSSNQANNAIYKIPRRFVKPRLANSYSAVEETSQDTRLGATNNMYRIIGSASDYNQTQVFEAVFKPRQFLISSPLMSAMYDRYDQFRVRSCRVDFESCLVGASGKAPRIQTAVWWCPNHKEEDAEVSSGEAPGYAYWTQLMESSHVSMLNHSPYKRFSLSYIPQVIDADLLDVEELEGKVNIEYTYGDRPTGWIVTNETNKDLECRGPYVHFRRPFVGAGVPEIEVDAMSVVYTVVFEFRNADTDN